MQSVLMYPAQTESNLQVYSFKDNQSNIHMKGNARVSELWIHALGYKVTAAYTLPASVCQC